MATLRMIMRWLTRNHNIWLVILCVSLYAFLKVTFIHKDITWYKQSKGIVITLPLDLVSQTTESFPPAIQVPPEAIPNHVTFATPTTKEHTFVTRTKQAIQGQDAGSPTTHLTTTNPSPVGGADPKTSHIHAPVTHIMHRAPTIPLSQTTPKPASALNAPMAWMSTCSVDFLGTPIFPQVLNCANSATCSNITCRDLLLGGNSFRATAKDKALYERARASMRDHPKEVISNASYINLTRDCDRFKKSHGYILEPMDTEEASFPIAYNILMHTDVEQVERLLRAIYRPQNSYCIHVDGNAAAPVQQAVSSIVNCFPNVFLPSKVERIVYAGISRLQADINCMTDHLAKFGKFKYLLNLAGQSFPLKTNLELVKILKIYNGSNDIEGISGNRIITKRFVFEWIEKDFKYLIKSGRLNPNPPHNIHIVRGSAFGVFSHDFVDYIINDPWSKDFLEWSRKTFSPDEHFWATLHHTYFNKHLNPPGNYPGYPDTKPWLAVYVKWGGEAKCHGKWRRGVCVLGVEDLPDLIIREEMFCNKFYLDFQPLGLDCLEAWIKQKTHCPPVFDAAFYQNLPFVKKSHLQG